MVEKFDYIESQTDADELIAEFGQIGAIPRTETTPGPNAWTRGGDVTVFHRITCAVLPIKEQDVDGTLIKAGDHQALISPLGLTIKPGTTDTVMFNGVFVGNEYAGGNVGTIVSIKSLAPAGVPVVYDAVVRI